MSDSSGAKVAPIINKEFPADHLNAGVKSNAAAGYSKQKTSEILGDKTIYPKPITNDKAWKNK